MIGSGWRRLAVAPRHALLIGRTSRIHLVLFGMHNRTFGPYLAVINRIRTLPQTPAGPVLLPAHVSFLSCSSHLSKSGF
jgi:hypothetical protein